MNKLIILLAFTTFTVNSLKSQVFGSQLLSFPEYRVLQIPQGRDSFKLMNGFYFNADHKIIDESDNVKNDDFYSEMKSLALLDSTVIYKWIEADQYWENVWKTEYIYDEYLNRSGIAKYEWNLNNESWKGLCNNIRIFDSKGNTIEFIQLGWDEVSGVWLPLWKYFNLYSTENQIITNLYYLWDNSISSWSNKSKSVYTYDEKGNLISVDSFGWNDNIDNWLLTEKVTHKYNTQSLPIELCSHRLDTISFNWIGTRRESYAWDAMGRKTELIKFTWDTLVSGWTELYREHYSYNGDNISEILAFKWSEEWNNWLFYSLFQNIEESGRQERLYFYWNKNSKKWIGSEKVVGIYENQVNLVDLIFYHWDTLIEDWVPYLKGEKKFNHNNKIIENILLKYYPFSGEWIPEEKSIYNYNEFELTLEKIYFRYFGEEWNPDSRSTYTYDAQNKKNEELAFKWDILNEQWRKTQKIKYFYSDNILLQSENAVIDHQVVLYPNPTKNTVYIKNFVVGRADLFNATGNIVLTAFPSEQIDISHLSPGMYLLRVETTEGVETHKLVKL